MMARAAVVGWDRVISSAAVLSLFVCCCFFTENKKHTRAQIQLSCYTTVSVQKYHCATTRKLLFLGPLRLNANKQRLGRLRSSCGLWDALDLDGRVEHMIWMLLSHVTG